MNGMAHLGENSIPVIRAATGLHADDARRQIGDESCQLASTELFLQYDVSVFIYAVKLKALFGYIDSKHLYFAFSDTIARGLPSPV
uniref:Uncharacterized protein n=2 Tax=Candidatus Kentrum eta TaxID=2126337 RepID=A0A450V8S2_9GAMM|nr:MAG: hypothetical protein BECKH772B_GA0070898_101607 [Candidatus Kentron sp. H]VFK01205.1 MAG: hypothetical protein BECKH772B_GA0070898_102217 [Candidatus Kentron sp. H]VFK04967.1 MAG: hypothetical protein BECKH772B_GA0070898_105112 [Candidatus Kentron sp. H]VFK09011.1 MAG: hypothetical protein BECKH772C_GA0070978_105691 [Candidatus Kentron sp. H]